MPLADLLAPVHAPTLLWERGEIPVGEPLFHGGFYGAEPSVGEAATRWLSDRPGRLVIPFAGFERGPRRLGLEARALSGSTVRVRILFDGTDLGGFEQGQTWRAHRFDLPAGCCGLGRHLLELRPRVVTSAAGSGGLRPRSVALRRVWLEPSPPGAEEPRLDRRGLLLPPGTAASWAFWVPAQGRLDAGWTGSGDGGGVSPFSVLTDDAPERRLRQPDLRALAGQPVRLVAAVPPTAPRPLRVSRLLLTGTPGPARAAPAVEGKSLLVIGTLSEGFPITPCSTARKRALGCLLSGREAAAFGFPAVAAFDHVGHEPGAVAAFLESAAPPAAAALVLPDQPARPMAERIGRRVAGLQVLMAGLPRAGEDLTVLAATAEPVRAPVHARDLDLTATALAMAGAPAEGLDGLDLRPALSGRAPAAVRPVVPVWWPRRSVALAGGRRFELRVGEVRPAASVLEACALAYLRRRRRALDWLSADRARPVRPRPAAGEPQ